MDIPVKGGYPASGIIRGLKQANIRFYPKKLFFPPEWIVLGVNNTCNLRCKMCDVGVGFTKSNFYRNLAGTMPRDMPMELLASIISQAAKFFPGIKLGYAFTEPLLYPHLIPSLHLAENKGLFTAVTTNALTLKEVSGDLARAGLNDIFISLDGPEKVHNMIRGHKKAFQRAMEGIEALLSEQGRPGISVFCVITEWNIGHLEEFVDLFREIPLKQLSFMHTNFTTRDLVEEHNRAYGRQYPATVSCVEKIDLSRMHLDILMDEIRTIDSTSPPFPVTFSPEIRSIDQLKIFYRKPEKMIGKTCYDAFRNIMIKTDGSVIPAHGRCYNITVGHLNRQSLREIWNSRALGQFRKDLIRAGGLFPACARCCSAFF